MFVDFIGPQASALACVFAAVTIAFYCVFLSFDPYWLRVRCRISDLSGERQEPKPRTSESESKQASSPALRFIGASKLLGLFQFGDGTQLRNRMAMAGIHSTAVPSRLVALRVLLMTVPTSTALVAGIAGYLPIRGSLFVCFLSVAIGYVLPGFWLDRAIKRYRLMLRTALPDFLDLMIVCLDAGLSLQESVKRVGEELRLVHTTFSFELSVVQRDIELGASVDQALRRFATRTDYDAVRTLSTLIREGQKFGTNVSEALRGHSEMLRYQREQAAEENAQKASVKILFPTMLFIFPAIFVVLVSPAAFKIQEAFMNQ